MITHAFGFPRAGKTTYAAYLVDKWLKDKAKGESTYRYVFTNFACKGAYKIHYDDLGLYDFSDSFIIIDESMLYADNRDWKQFDFAKKQFIALHGHFKCDLLFLSQDVKGIDRKIDSCAEGKKYIVKIPIITLVIKIPRCITYPEGEIRMGFKKPSIIDIVVRSEKIIRKKYFHMFDSFEKPKLPKYKKIPW